MLVVDEEGAEAAAATAVEAATADASIAASPPKPFVFRADRPFRLVLRDKVSRGPLFMAYVAAPRRRVRSIGARRSLTNYYRPGVSEVLA